MEGLQIEGFEVKNKNLGKIKKQNKEKKKIYIHNIYT